MSPGPTKAPGLDARLRLARPDGFRLDLALSVPAGRTAALLGPNGAGKSTLVEALAGLLPIDAGRIALAGRVLDDPASDVFMPPDRRRVGVLFQDYLLFPHLSVRENVAFGPRAQGLGRTEAHARAEDWLARVGLEGLGARRPGALSGGQRQRAALARALATEPELLLLDEPLAALDVATRARLRQELAAHLEAFAGPRLLITHDPAEAFLLADEIHVLEAGALTQSGDADEIRLRPRSRYAAELAGLNLVAGHAADGIVEAGAQALHVAERDLRGPVLATIAPTAISLYRARPEGSPRNAWRTEVEVLERFGGRVRLRVGAPLPLTVEITEDAVEALGLAPGERVWLAIKATEIGLQPDV